MGYPMGWRRALRRNGLEVTEGDGYDSTPNGLIRGDLHRVERDMQDEVHVAMLAAYAHTTRDKVRRVLDGIFNEPWWYSLYTTDKALYDKIMKVYTREYKKKFHRGH